jgi:hypothetical protein
VSYERRFLATSGPEVDAECARKMSIGDSITQPFAPPAMYFYATERYAITPESPSSTGPYNPPLLPRTGANPLYTPGAGPAASGLARYGAAEAGPTQHPVISSASSAMDPPRQNVASSQAPSAATPSIASSATPSSRGFLDQRLPDSLAVNDSRASSVSTNYSELVENLSAQFECISTTDDGCVTVSPFQRKTLQCANRDSIQSSKYVSITGVDLLDRLRYDDIAIAVVNDIYIKSFADRTPADGPNRISFLCSLWRAGWSDGEEKAVELLNSMKPFSC